jgi:hypothetical protein
MKYEMIPSPISLKILSAMNISIFSPLTHSLLTSWNKTIAQVNFIMPLLIIPRRNVIILRTGRALLKLLTFANTYYPTNTTTQQQRLCCVCFIHFVFSFCFVLFILFYFIHFVLFYSFLYLLCFVLVLGLSIFVCQPKTLKINH